MDDLARYDLSDGIATITLDDGKVNALSPAMSNAVLAQLDRAEADAEAKAVILTGREKTFSAGFDLRVPLEAWPEMLERVGTLAKRLLGFPKPTIVAANGNAIAMGAFLLLAADYRLGVDAPAKIGLNEVAIGLTMPWFGLHLAEHRLTRPAFDRCCVLGEFLDPAGAVVAGFLDATTAPETLQADARAVATRLSGVDLVAHARTKLRVRQTVLDGLDADLARLKGPTEDW